MTTSSSRTACAICLSSTGIVPILRRMGQRVCGSLHPGSTTPLSATLAYQTLWSGVNPCGCLDQFFLGFGLFEEAFWLVVLVVREQGPAGTRYLARDDA